MTGNSLHLDSGLGMDGTAQEMKTFCVHLCLEMAILIYISKHSTCSPEHPMAFAN